MNPATRTTLEGWRRDIADEIEIAAAEVSASSAALQAAETAEAAEKSRVHELVTVFGRLAKNVPLSNALRHRFEDARKMCPAAATRGHAEAVAAVQFKLEDLRAALDQLDALLRPPAPPAPALIDTRAAPAAAGFDPLVPARVA